MCSFIVDLCVSVGGIATAGSFIYLICDSKNKAKQLQSVQMIEFRQLNALYKPDIRISHKRTPANSPSPSEIILSNYGENIRILSYNDISNHLDKNSLNSWNYPLYFNKTKDIRIPLSHDVGDIPDNISFELSIENNLDVLYTAKIFKDKGNLVISIEPSST